MLSSSFENLADKVFRTDIQLYLPIRSNYSAKPKNSIIINDFMLLGQKSEKSGNKCAIEFIRKFS